MVPLPPPSAARPRALLLVDDEPDILESLRGFLEASIAGLKVVAAPSGLAGLDALDRQSIDLIVSDFKMPGMDGIAFLQEAGRRYPRIPRIMLTAFNDADLERRAVSDAGVGAFLSKAAAPAVLLAWISRLLGVAAPSTPVAPPPRTEANATAAAAGMPAR